VAEQIMARIVRLANVPSDAIEPASFHMAAP